MTLDIFAFAELLRQEQHLLDALHKLLLEQQQQLKLNDFTAFEALQPDSAALVTQLQTQCEQRLHWMSEQQLPLSKDCLQLPILQCHSDLAEIWHQLDHSYQQNQTLSATLAETVLHLRHRTQRKLDILRGQPDESRLYDNKGKASLLALGHKYVRA